MHLLLKQWVMEVPATYTHAATNACAQAAFAAATKATEAASAAAAQSPAPRAHPERPPGFFTGGAAAESQDLPYEARTIAVIGNLGWDEPEEVLLSRAKQTLDLARVDGGTWR